MKLKVFISALACVTTIGLATSQNQSQTKRQNARNTQNRTAFIDRNNNGVCDNFENGTPRNTHANGKKAFRNKSGKNRNKAIRNRRGQGNRSGLRNGKGKQVNFADANHNGVCDRREKIIPKNQKK